MKNIKLVDNKICTGCGACLNICKKHAINMFQFEDGFLYPVIDERKCNDCGLCLKVCPAYNPIYDNSKEPDCFALQAPDEIRMKSTSGGAFSLFANYVLEQKGYVCGAAWNKNFDVEHIIINNTKDLDKIRYSKYIQSNTVNVYHEIKNLLIKDNFVLFSGTPCQVAALKKFLHKNYPKLLTLDVVCHGVPSAKIWHDFLSELSFKDDIENINFRPKEDGWGACNLTFYLKDGSVKKFPRNNPYYLGFEKGLFYRSSCGSCPFNHIPRQGDISLADFWGIEFFDKPLRDYKGTSCIIKKKKKGRDVFNIILEKAKLIKRKPIAECIKYNRCFYAPYSVNQAKRERFFELRKTQNFVKSVNFALNNKYDIGIVGIWFFENYGAILTVYALYKLLESFGFISILIDSSGFLKNKHLEQDNIISRSFMRKYKVPMTGILRSSDELSKLNETINNFVLASDQLWHYPKPFGKTFFLDFANDNKRKISIATSFGDGYIDPVTEYDEAKFHMNRLDRVSVREDMGISICKEVFGICDAKQILDPVFLCDLSVYENLILCSKKIEPNKYLLCYLLDDSSKDENLIQEISSILKLKIVYINDVDYLRKKEKAQQNIDIEDWLYYFKHAEAVITDSFHGTCFAMIFGKPFVSIVNQSRGISRFTSLLKLFNEEERLCFSQQHLLDFIDFLKYFDVDNFKNNLKLYRNESISWILDSLTFEKNGPISSYDLIVKRIKNTNNGKVLDDRLIQLLLAKDLIIRKYWKYRILRKIYFGNRRTRYKKKYQKYKELVKELQSYVQGTQI